MSDANKAAKVLLVKSKGRREAILFNLAKVSKSQIAWYNCNREGSGIFLRLT